LDVVKEVTKWKQFNVNVIMTIKYYREDENLTNGISCVSSSQFSDILEFLYPHVHSYS